MTLSRQLILLVIALVVLLFAGTFLISAYNTRDYIEAQLASHAQDAATSLGLSATTHMNEQDRATVTSLVNAMFHRGDYLSIRLVDLKGEPWVERVADLEIDGVPGWFVRAFELQAPEGLATMMSGWRQVGEVSVRSHPGLAYAKLWATTRETFNWFIAGAIGVLLLGLLGLRMLLRPLKAVEQQADAICKREFPVVERRPFTLEFRRVVEAMNRLSRKVQQMLAESERLAARLREQAYQDPVTGLANRRQFMDVLNDRVQDQEAIQTGGVMLLQLKNFKGYNLTHGYAAGDTLLAHTADLLRDVLAACPTATAAHLAGADFAVLLEGVGEARLAELAHDVADALSGLYVNLELPSSDVGHVGVAGYGGQAVSEWLSMADLALRQAQTEGANAWSMYRESGRRERARTASEWRDLLERAACEGLFRLQRQPVVRCADRSLIHYEVFVRLQDPDDPEQTMSAGAFMPMVESVGLAALLDKSILGLALDALAADGGTDAFAVNLSPASLGDQDLLDWLEVTMRARPQEAARLVLELPEYGATAHVARLVQWVERLGVLGVRFSLDHFGKGFASFAYLRSIKADYLKIDGSFIRQLEQSPDNQFYLQAVSEIAHGLDMQIIAESVETQAVWEMLPSVNVDGARGYWLGRPV